MTVRLSTSSSNDRLPKGNWPIIWFCTLVLFLLAVVFVEYDIRRSGWTPSVVDSERLWAQQRKRASALKDQAIILVGTSRIQLGMDLEVVKKISKLEPVQLAIDGSPFLPVLKSLADDPNIMGTVIVSVNTNLSLDEESRSSSWVRHYEDNIKNNNKEPYKVINDAIAMFFENNMVTRLEGAKPFTAISALIFKEASFGNYLVTHLDRSRDADYSKVKMPHFYMRRTQRHYGENILNNKSSIDGFFSTYERAINNIKAVNNSYYLEKVNHLISLIKIIEKRGGNVVLVRFPTSKLIWDIDQKKHPRKMFWNELEKLHKPSIHFSDYVSLSKYKLPDGSHLDYRDKADFTASLVEIIMRISDHNKTINKQH